MSEDIEHLQLEINSLQRQVDELKSDLNWSEWMHLLTVSFICAAIVVLQTR